MCLLLLALVLYWITTAFDPYISKNFHYAADMQVTENTFDAAEGRYNATHYYQATYSTQAMGATDDSTSLRNTLQTIDPQQPASATIEEQEYVAHSRDGRIWAPANDRLTNEYAFAPRHLRAGDSFESRLTRYPVPATMRYQGEEEFYGLQVYRYTASYNDKRLTAPGKAPNGQGREYAPQVTAWIEPTTGWLVRLHDTVTEYYYDTATGEQLSPIATTTRVFDDESVRQNADYARQQKYQLDFGLQVAPSILLVVVLITVVRLVVRRINITAMPVQLPAIIVLTVCAANAAGWLWYITPLQRLFSGSVELHPFANFCFMLVALGMLVLYHRQHKSRKYLVVIGGLVTVLSLAAAARSAGIISVGGNQDQWLSLFGMLIFAVFGITLIKAAYADTAAARTFAKMNAGVTIILGVSGLLAKLLLLDEVFLLSSVASLSVSGSILCILCGFGLLQTLLLRYDKLLIVTGRIFVRALARPALLAIPLLLIGVVAQYQQIGMRSHLQAAFNEQVKSFQSNLQNTSSLYASTLVSARALYAASQNVERDEWRAFIAAQDTSTKYPSIQGVGYAAQVQRGEKTAYQIFPATSAAVQFPVIYIEPTNPENAKLLGYDMASNPSRLDALRYAVATNTPVNSSADTLLQETSENKKGFVLFLPVYKNGLPIETDAERLAALQGVVFAPFKATEFFNEVLQKEVTKLTVAVYDGVQAAPDKLLFGRPPSGEKATARLETTETIYVHNHPWTITYSLAADAALSPGQLRGPTTVLVGGGLFYLMSLAAGWSILRLRQQAAARKDNRSS